MFQTAVGEKVTLLLKSLKKSIERRPCLSLYVGGLVATLNYVVALIAIPGGAEIFHAPYGFYDGQYWLNTDAINYVRPAKYFLSHGAFLDYLGGALVPSHWGVCVPLDGINSPEQLTPRLTPTYHRVIGYSLIIAIFMKSFGPYWDLILAAFNVFAFAFIYPLLFLIAKLIFPSKWNTAFIVWPFLFLLICGTYIYQVPFYLADMTVTLLFLTGIYFGLKSQLHLRWVDLLGHVFFLSLACLVKSILSYFVFVDLLVLASFAYRRGTLKKPKSRLFIVLSFLAILLASQFSFIRNYVNHQRYMPEDILATNLFCYLAREVAQLAGDEQRYVEGIKDLYKVDPTDVAALDANKIEKTREIIYRYPATSGYVLFQHALTVLYRSHLHLFGRTLVQRPYSTLLWVILFPLNYLLYTFLYAAFLMFCLRLVWQKEFLLLATLAVLVGYMFVPTILTAGGSRMRLPFEGLIVIVAFAEVYNRTVGVVGSGPRAHVFWVRRLFHGKKEGAVE